MILKYVVLNLDDNTIYCPHTDMCERYGKLRVVRLLKKGAVLRCSACGKESGIRNRDMQQFSIPDMAYIAMGPDPMFEQLDFDVAVSIARELEGSSEERMFEIAVGVMVLNKRVALEAVKKAKKYPKKPINEIVEMVYGIPKHGQIAMSFSPELYEKLTEACVNTHTSIWDLVPRIIEKGLRKDGYL